MNHNDILRSIRYTFDYSDKKMLALFAFAGCELSREQLRGWLAAEDAAGRLELDDRHLALFLDGLIIAKRGRQEGPLPEPAARLNNNIILRKLKIALNMQNTELLETLQAAHMTLSPHELSALFRKPEHKNYRACQDQLLRRFLQGLQRRIRPETARSKPRSGPVRTASKAAGKRTGEKRRVWPVRPSNGQV